ncbi:hypothetical protein ES705_32944 [subsurface metagenome]
MPELEKLILYWKVVKELASGQLSNLSHDNVEETITALEELNELKKGGEGVPRA